MGLWFAARSGIIAGGAPRRVGALIDGIPESIVMGLSVLRAA
jgi:hypothetical protein